MEEESKIEVLQKELVKEQLEGSIVWWASFTLLMIISAFIIDGLSASERTCMLVESMSREYLLKDADDYGTSDARFELIARRVGEDYWQQRAIVADLRDQIEVGLKVTAPNMNEAKARRYAQDFSFSIAGGFEFDEAEASEVDIIGNIAYIPLGIYHCGVKEYVTRAEPVMVVKAHYYGHTVNSIFLVGRYANLNFSVIEFLLVMLFVTSVMVPIMTRRSVKRINRSIREMQACSKTQQ